jgi:hypothetical protein
MPTVIIYLSKYSSHNYCKYSIQKTLWIPKFDAHFEDFEWHQLTGSK